MHERVPAVTGFAILFGASLAIAEPAPGTWPAYADDISRTARAGGVGQLKSPEVAWRRFMGGALATQEVLVADADGDGRTDVLTISGGRVLASRGDGTAMWQTGILGPAV